jgi:hypothetical protein
MSWKIKVLSFILFHCFFWFFLPYYGDHPVKTFSKIVFQAAHGGAKIHWKGLYSGLSGNLAGVLPLVDILIRIERN